MEGCPVLRKKLQSVFSDENASWLRIKHNIFVKTIAPKLLQEFPKERDRFRMIRSYRHTMGNTGDLLISIQDFVDQCVTGQNSFSMIDLSSLRESLTQLNGCINSIVDRSTFDSLGHIVVIIEWIEAISSPAYQTT
jgi:hypothetical protein